MDLYHCDIRLPKIRFSHLPVQVQWTRHADRARKDDRYGVVPRFEEVVLTDMKVIEVGIERGRIAKILFRKEMDNDLDVCMVLIPAGIGSPWTVKTVWINQRNDRHRTLDRSKYCI